MINYDVENFPFTPHRIEFGKKRYVGSDDSKVPEFYRSLRKTFGFTRRQNGREIAFIVVAHFVHTLPHFLEALSSMGDIAALISKQSGVVKHVREAISKIYKDIIVDFQKINKDSLTKAEVACSFFDDLIKPENEKWENHDFIILDHGGYFAPCLYEVNDKLPEFKNRIIGIVEHTYNGEVRYAEKLELQKTFPFPVLSIAHSDLKKLENESVARSIVDAITVKIGPEGLNQSIYDLKHILIIGFGNIGKCVADVLEKRLGRERIYICEKLEKNLKEAEKIFTPKHVTNEIQKFLKDADLIITAASAQVLGNEEFALLKSGAIIACATSSDDQFTPNALQDFKPCLPENTSKEKSIRKQPCVKYEYIKNAVRSNENEIKINENIDESQEKNFYLFANGDSANFLIGSTPHPVLHIILASICVSAYRIVTNSKETWKKDIIQQTQLQDDQQICEIYTQFFKLPADVTKTEIKEQIEKFFVEKIYQKAEFNFETYVDILGQEQIYEKPTFMSGKIKNFLDDTEKKAFLILADAGMGKTTLCKQITKKLLEDFKETQNDHLPIYIYLPAVLNKNQTLHEGFLEKYLKKEMLLNVEDINKFLKQQWPVVLILDGLDEVPWLGNIFRDLENWNIKLICACRPEAIVTRSGYKKDLSPNAEINYFSQINLCHFDPEQIKEYIIKYLDKLPINNKDELSEEWLDAETYITHLNKLPGLKELAGTPVILSMIVTELPAIIKTLNNSETKEKDHITRIKLYEIFIEQWFKRAEKRLREEQESYPKLFRGNNSLKGNLELYLAIYAKNLAVSQINPEKIDVIISKQDTKNKLLLEPDELTGFDVYLHSKKPSDYNLNLYKEKHAACLYKIDERQYQFICWNENGEWIKCHLDKETCELLNTRQHDTKIIDLDLRKKFLDFTRKVGGHVYLLKPFYMNDKKTLKKYIEAIRSGCLLKVEHAGFQFKHKSILEYLAANELSLAMLWSAQNVIHQGSKNIALDKFQKTLLVNQPAVIKNMAEIATAKPEFKAALWNWIELSKKHKMYATAAANAITILVKSGVVLSGLDLSDIKIPGADLSRSICHYTKFNNADLTDVNFNHAYVANADFSNAIMHNVNFGVLQNQSITVGVYEGFGFIENGDEIKCKLVCSENCRYLALYSNATLFMIDLKNQKEIWRKKLYGFFDFIAENGIHHVYFSNSDEELIVIGKQPKSFIKSLFDEIFSKPKLQFNQYVIQYQSSTGKEIKLFSSRDMEKLVEKTDEPLETIIKQPEKFNIELSENGCTIFKTEINQKIFDVKFVDFRAKFARISPDEKLVGFYIDKSNSIQIWKIEEKRCIDEINFGSQKIIDFTFINKTELCCAIQQRKFSYKNPVILRYLNIESRLNFYENHQFIHNRGIDKLPIYILSQKGNYAIIFKKNESIILKLDQHDGIYKMHYQYNDVSAVITFSQCENYLITWTSDGNQIKILENRQNGEVIENINYFQDPKFFKNPYGENQKIRICDVQYSSRNKDILFCAYFISDLFTHQNPTIDIINIKSGLLIKRLQQKNSLVLGGSDYMIKMHYNFDLNRLINVGTNGLISHWYEPPKRRNQFDFVEQMIQDGRGIISGVFEIIFKAESKFHMIRCSALNQSGQILAVAAEYLSSIKGHIIMLWSIPDKKVLQILSGQGEINCLAFDSDDKKLIAYDKNGNCFKWDLMLVNNEPRYVLTGGDLQNIGFCAYQAIFQNTIGLSSKTELLLKELGAIDKPFENKTSVQYEEKNEKYHNILKKQPPEIEINAVETKKQNPHYSEFKETAKCLFLCTNEKYPFIYKDNYQRKSNLGKVLFFAFEEKIKKAAECNEYDKNDEIYTALNEHFTSKKK